MINSQHMLPVLEVQNKKINSKVHSNVPEENYKCGKRLKKKNHNCHHQPLPGTQQRPLPGNDFVLWLSYGVLIITASNNA